MPLKLPAPLRHPQDYEALTMLARYYKLNPRRPLGTNYAGARFDGWDSTGTREHDQDRFTADDIVAVGLLSVQVSPHAAGPLLEDPGDRLSKLLVQIEKDLDLVDVPDGVINKGWAAWILHDELRKLRGIDWVIAGKLLARKRPRLIPIYDRVVREVVDARGEFWESLRRHLATDSRRLHDRLLSLKQQADLHDTVTALRVFDVVAWMTGKDLGY